MLQTTAFLSLLICLSSCYSFSQALHFNNLINSRILVREVLGDEAVDPHLKDRLILASDVVAFARANGLTVEDSYTYYIANNGRAVSYSVKAALPLQMQFKTWWFPFTGNVPYLGFYSRRERDQRANELKSQGYDVAVGSIAAFSSLGWFSDPLFESMLQGEKFRLIHLLFHELTHRTIWFSGNVTFNENLAEFIAIKLTISYLSEHNLENDKLRYLDYLSDRSLYHKWLSKLESELRILYKNEEKKSETDLRQDKSQIISRFTQEEHPLFKGQWFRFLLTKEWNNASILAARLYGSEWAQFEQVYECKEIEKPLAYIEMIHAQLEAVPPSELFKELANLCQ